MKDVLGGWIIAFLALVLWNEVQAQAVAASEEKYALLKVGTHTYTNVTVTTKSKSYVFIFHSQGMTNFKVSELPPETLTLLGYKVEEPKTNNTASAWAKQAMTKVDTAKLKKVEAQLQEALQSNPTLAKVPVKIPELTPSFLLAFAGVMLVLYLFFSFCCMLICKKAGTEPGILVWLPLLKLFALLKAARMSGWWFFAFLVPGLNLLAQIIWCFKIADARGKTAFVGILLILPVTSLFAFLYLAFSNGAPVAEEETKPRRMELMTLETA